MSSAPFFAQRSRSPCRYSPSPTVMRAPGTASLTIAATSRIDGARPVATL